MNEIENQFSRMALLIGDKARALMLWNLLDGRAYTATELSLCADISAQSASNHLSKLVNSKILAVEKQGRHRYYRYATPEIARVIESIASLLPQDKKAKEKEKLPAIRYARTCYDHIAGKLGVEIAHSLIQNQMITTVGKNYEITRAGKNWFAAVGVSIEEVTLQNRSFAHQCLDWSERKHHIAGALGASLLQMMVRDQWIRKTAHSREVILTAKGKAELKKRLSLEM